MYTSWLSNSFVLVIADVSLSKNLDWSDGLYKIRTSIGLVLGSKISKNRFSISLENPPLDLNKLDDLILNLTPENMTQHPRIDTKMSKINGRQIQ